MSKKSPEYKNPTVASEGKDKEVEKPINEEIEKVQEQTEASPEQEKKDLQEIVAEEKSGKSVFAKVRKFINDYAVEGLLESGQLVTRVVEGAVDTAGNAINALVKPTSKFLTGFIPEGHVAMITDKIVVKGTEIGVGVAKGLAKASFHAFTLGTFCWMDAVRQHMAVNAGSKEIRSGKNRQEVTALSYIDHLEDPEIKKNLNQYYELRANLAEWKENPDDNKDKIVEAAQKIAQFEVLYKDCVDFSNLKSILEKGMEFVKNNEVLIDKLAGDTADKMISEVENYYKNKLGSVAGGVKGEWLQAATGENGRDQLKLKIADRLREVMKQELSDKELKREMKKINSDLKKSFGVTNRYFKAAMYTIMGLVMHNIKFEHAPDAPKIEIPDGVPEPVVDSTLNQISAANDMYTNVNNPSSIGIKNVVENYKINPDLSITDTTIVTPDDPSTYVPDATYDSFKDLVDDKSINIDVESGADKIKEVAGELVNKIPGVAEAVEDVSKAKRLYNGAKMAMNATLNVVSNSPALWGAKAGYQLLKYFI